MVPCFEQRRNFGQANYGAAKMAVIGLMNTLVLEGAKYNIKVNALAPSAATRMTNELFPPDVLKTLTAEAVTAGALALVHKESPNRYTLCAGAGGYASAQLFETEGIYLPVKQQTPEAILDHMSEISDPSHQQALETGFLQPKKFLSKALAYSRSSSR